MAFEAHAQSFSGCCSLATWQEYLMEIACLRRQSLAEWFSVGLLHLHCIEWHTASAALLEKVMKYEAVHAFQVRLHASIMS